MKLGKNPLTRLTTLTSRVLVIVSLLYGSAVLIGLPARAVPPTNVNLPRVTGFESEPNDAPATATPLTGPPDQRVRGNIYRNGDVDFYSFTASTGDRVYAAVMTLGSTANQNSLLDLIASDGATVLEADDDDGTFTSLSSSIAGAPIPSDGTYFLRVRDEDMSTERPYDLYFRIRTGVPTTESEPNDDLSAQPLPASGWVAGTANPDGDDDTFTIPLSAGDTAFMALDLDPERDGTTWNGAALLGPFDGSTFYFNDPNTVSPNSEALFATVREAGDLTLAVENHSLGGDPSFSYHLSVAVIPAETMECRKYAQPAPTAIPDQGNTLVSHMHVPDDIRLARVAMDIDITHPDMDELDLVLETPSANEIAPLTDIAAPFGDMRLTVDDLGVYPARIISSDLMVMPDNSALMEWTAGEMSGGAWSLEITDDTSGDTGTLNSWGLILCEAPPSASGSRIYSNDFEANDGGFIHHGMQDEWERGLPSFGPISSCASGAHCWKTDLDGNYDPSSSQDLISPPISLANQTGPIELSWARRYQMGDAEFDHFFVEVRQVGGGRSRRVFEWTGPHMRDAVGNHPDAVVVEQSAGWGVSLADITDFGGQTIEIRFHLDSDSTQHLAGVAIDDITIVGQGSGLVSPPGTGTGTEPSIAVNGGTAREGKPLKFLVSLSVAATQAVTVAYATTPGTAKRGKDFKSSSGTLNFAPGETAEQIVVKTKNDSKDEKNEKLVVTLSGPSGATLGTAQGTGKIKDND